MSAYTIRSADWQHDAGEIRRIREIVFVVEQAVPSEIEWDGLDPTCLHVLAEDRNRDAVATGRLHPSGKIGRMAVLREWRGHGVGAALLEHLIEAARERKMKDVYLHSQTRAMGFYARQGFIAEGDEFDEAGIPHRLMRLGLRQR